MPSITTHVVWWPRPRPDFAIMRGGTLVALLDAKYRDLWERGLPREMLYQLALYAVSRGKGGQAAILYPTATPAAQEERIVVQEPIGGGRMAEALLRPVNLLELDRLLAVRPASASQQARVDLARRLALGG